MLKLINFVKKKLKNTFIKNEYLYHLLVWGIYFTLTNFNFYLSTGGNTSVLSIFIGMLLVAIILFYANIYIVIPNFLAKKKYLGQLLGMLLLLTIYIFFRYLSNFYLFPLLGEEYITYKTLSNQFFADSGWFATQYFLLSFGYWYALQGIEKERENKSLAVKVLEYKLQLNKLELDFLRQQISPHFVYNILSSVYFKVYKKMPDTGEIILLLSEIMSYSTSATKSDDEVPLEEEIRNIERFIELEKYRYGSDLDIDFHVNGSPDKEDQILPLVLLTFIENAFKYGDRNNPDRPITIKINIDEDRLTFYCSNVIQQLSTAKKSNKIGIANTQKRLELKYSGRYTLSNRAERDEYIVNFYLDFR
ncbi:histidine kinase [Arcicella sp. LKC2W]|uniref:sensor histidine kinase n=1 Tax=Arcicella sp. LKC2W TaxID=2984198 RepID=UPI002B2004DC|nr:histidine kinase [Arcicella sp. LKC2W]MEA5461125.1 histidine kinase [Arcicella sp. LKC2W]